LVCSPTRWAYNYLLPQFDKTPDPDQAAIEDAGMWLGKETLFARMIEAAKAKLQSWTAAPADGEKHPRLIVLNAFKRRGGRMVATKGTTNVHWGGFLPRSGYVNAEELPFYTMVEEYT
jgi:hypothetical protein